ncbi:MAG: glycosyltransferase family 4 protein [Candidatus Aenigmatarchaeota archaeon]|nr:MAG: glycosyltransferase family 4 protein [Candidatus Aenigmarchaeota archaeon]
MRIAQYCQSVFNVSRGTETFVKSISSEISKRCEVHLIAGNGKGTVRGKNLKTFKFPYLMRSQLPHEIPREQQYAAECCTFYLNVASHMKRHRYDAIHIHLPINLMLKSVTRDPILMNFHGGGSIVSYKDLLNTVDADAYCACSRFIADWAARTIKKKVQVVYDGVDPEYFRPMQVKRKDGKTVLLYLGALLMWKGFDYLLRAMETVQKKNKNIELWIAGMGNDADKIKGIIKRLGLQNTRMLGYIPQSEVIRLYNSCDAFVSASPEEPFGITFVEAMACGKPIIAINNAGPKEIAARGTGFLAAPRSSADLAKKILQAAESDLVRMGEKARSHVVKNFTWERTVDSLMKIYGKI